MSGIEEVLGILLLLVSLIALAIGPPKKERKPRYTVYDEKD